MYVTVWAYIHICDDQVQGMTSNVNNWHQNKAQGCTQGSCDVQLFLAILIKVLILII